MVYCEFIRYHGETVGRVTPSKEIPYECKQGQLFKILLLQPLISTQTIVVKRQEFLDIGGFNEKLKTYEDYEFTLRFSQHHMIGFVEEPLVKVYDSPNSVNRQYADRLRTQAYIVREMIAPLREYGFLSKKLSAMQKEAEVLICHDVFMEEIHQLMDLFITDQEKAIAIELLEETEQSEAKKSLSKGVLKQELLTIKQQLLNAYLRIYENNFTEVENMSEILQAFNVSMTKCVKLFSIPSSLQSTYMQLQAMTDPNTKMERLLLLTDIINLIESVEAFIVQQVYECNICEQKVFRSQKQQCPFCGADHRERLVIAFLQELQPEDSEKLIMLQILTSTLLENYALERTDILLEKFFLPSEVLHTLYQTKDEKYDLIVYPMYLEKIDHIPEITGELYRVMKPSGIGIVLLPSDHRKQDHIAWLKETGFYLDEIGENWFGSEIYQKYGFDKHLTIHVFTKAKPLSEM